MLLMQSPVCPLIVAIGFTLFVLAIGNVIKKFPALQMFVFFFMKVILWMHCLECYTSCTTFKDVPQDDYPTAALQPV